eukprot:32731-Prymnesium_polylepis.1
MERNGSLAAQGLGARVDIGVRLRSRQGGGPLPVRGGRRRHGLHQDSLPLDHRRRWLRHGAAEGGRDAPHAQPGGEVGSRC